MHSLTRPQQMFKLNIYSDWSMFMPHKLKSHPAAGDADAQCISSQHT